MGLAAGSIVLLDFLERGESGVLAAGGGGDLGALDLDAERVQAGLRPGAWSAARSAWAGSTATAALPGSGAGGEGRQELACHLVRIRPGRVDVVVGAYGNSGGTDAAQPTPVSAVRVGNNGSCGAAAEADDRVPQVGERGWIQQGKSLLGDQETVASAA